MCVVLADLNILQDDLIFFLCKSSLSRSWEFSLYIYGADELRILSRIIHKPIQAAAYKYIL
jgi:hypothetical protein